MDYIKIEPIDNYEPECEQVIAVFVYPDGGFRMDTKLDAPNTLMIFELLKKQILENDVG